MEYDVVFSMPCILSENGIKKIISIPLSEAERKILEMSAQELRKITTYF